MCRTQMTTTSTTCRQTLSASAAALRYPAGPIKKPRARRPLQPPVRPHRGVRSEPGSKPDSSRRCRDHSPASVETLVRLSGSDQMRPHASVQRASWRWQSTKSARTSGSASGVAHSISHLLSSRSCLTTSPCPSWSEKDWTRARFAARPPRRTAGESRRYRSRKANAFFIRPREDPEQPAPLALGCCDRE